MLKVYEWTRKSRCISVRSLSSKGPPRTSPMLTRILRSPVSTSILNHSKLQRSLRKFTTSTNAGGVRRVPSTAILLGATSISILGFYYSYTRERPHLLVHCDSQYAANLKERKTSSSFLEDENPFSVQCESYVPPSTSDFLRFDFAQIGW